MRAGALGEHRVAHSGERRHPLKYFNGDQSVVVTYTVTRVKPADVAKGTF